jgi:hypothetical protein
MIYPVQKTPGGIAVIPIGGGAFTKTFQFRAVMNGRNELKPAGFIRTTGILACELDQGVIPINVNDLIVDGTGSLPIVKENANIQIHAYRVLKIKDDHAVVIKEFISFETLPESVIIGASIYHNRDGSYFAGADQP